jgi:copper chaperone NosL
MNLKSRIILAAGALMIGFVYIFPIWTISLNAPQYPEGIGMYIWVNQITGHRQHDLTNINLLNHYIGMKEIVPESIPELKIMPYVFGFLLIFGLLAAAVGWRSLLIIWLVLFIGVMVAALVDFYLWGYDYGHNLSPDAPIKVPGMAYQPPLIGTKQLLNMKSSSYPYIGGYFLGLSMLSGAISFYVSRPKVHDPHPVA